MNRNKPSISVALNAFGGIAIVASLIFLASSFVIENDIGRAFCLGAFFSGLIGTILLFGFAKVIQQLDAIRAQINGAGPGEPTGQSSES